MKDFIRIGVDLGKNYFQIGFVQMPSRMSLGRRASDCRFSHDSATPDAFTFTMRYPVEEALRAKARGGIAEIAHGI